MQTRHAMPIWTAISTNLMVLVACSGANGATRSSVPTRKILFNHQLEARRPNISDYRILQSKGDNVANGDEVQVLVTPREDVYLYLGYCDGHMFALDPQGSNLLLAKAGRETRIPSENRIFTISGDSKSEILYVILSKSELSLASSDLSVKIANSGGSIDGDCVGQMRDSSNSPIPPPTSIIVRPSDNAIEVVRYELKRQASTVSP